MTYVARNLEPYRGFHVFMRALPQLLRRRKGAQVLFAATTRELRCTAPAKLHLPGHDASRARCQTDLERVHFFGLIDYEAYLKLLQVSPFTFTLRTRSCFPGRSSRPWLAVA